MVPPQQQQQQEQRFPLPDLSAAPQIKRDKHVLFTIGIFSPEVFVFPTGVSHFLEAIPRNPTWARSNFEGGGSKFRSRDWGSKKMLREGY